MLNKDGRIGVDIIFLYEEIEKMLPREGVVG